jgi:hypothetical protein
MSTTEMEQPEEGCPTEKGVTVSVRRAKAQAFEKAGGPARRCRRLARA